jgi:hypothetical protein
VDAAGSAHPVELEVRVREIPARSVGVNAVAAELRDAFVDAYPTYVRARALAVGAAEIEGLEAAIDEGGRWLGSTLGELLDIPFASQMRGPLEVFQEAMRFPTSALVAAGVERPDRDPVASASLPGDIYDLAPASSAVLGDEVWAAHMAWGAAKARAMLRSEG